MRIADRYIGWQVFYGTLFGVTLLTVVLVLGQLFKELRPLLVEQHAPLWLIGQFVLLILPFSLMFTLPWGFLASTLLSFGRLSSHNELIGFRMAGLSLFRVALPVLVIGIGFTILCNWLTGTAAPRAKEQSRNLIYEAVKRDPRALLDPGIVQSRFREQKVYVEAREENGILRGFHIYQLSDDSRDAVPVAYVYADIVDLFVDTELKNLRLKLTGAYIEAIRDDGSVELVFSDEAEPWLIDFSGTRKKKEKASDIANEDIPAAVARRFEDDEATRAGLAAGKLTEDEAAALLKKSKRKRKELHIELQKRRSLSFACLAFAFIGIPLGISARRKETSNGILLSLFVAAGYFGLVIFAEQISEAPLPVVVSVLWLPNAICLVLGLWLFHRAGRR